MARRSIWTMLAVWVTALALPAMADSLLHPISIDAGPLLDNLRTLERQTGIELLYDSSLMDGLRSPAVQEELTTEAALQRLLAGTALTARRAQSGAWIVGRQDAPALAKQDVAVSEILVVGRRTQNADIRRFEDDVQPYNVVTQTEIRRAHRDDINQLFSSRVTANSAMLPAGAPKSAEILSTIDLRGLGNDQTLILVDGRRMPSIPDSGSSFRQADINGIPLNAIKRIEVLAGAAGGIYGFGALGGVVNIVLDRDTRGLEMHFTGGISSRGDAGRTGLEASYGHTTESGKTDVSLFASWFDTDRLRVDERGFLANDRRLNRRFVPEDFSYEQAQGYAMSVLRSSFGPGPPSTLVFKPEFGGGALSSSRTLLPAAFSGNAAELVTALTNNAGQLNLGLTPEIADSDLGTNPESGSLLLNVRHRFNDRLEAYVDAVLLRTRGHMRDDGGADGFAYLAASSPSNPFTSDILVNFPIAGIEGGIEKKAEQDRFTVGIVAELPAGWRGMLELGSGSFKLEKSNFDERPEHPFIYLYGDPGDPDIDPFGDWSALQQAEGTDVTRYQASSSIRNRFRDYSLRLAGPIFVTSAGPSTLTVLAEHRAEKAPTSVDTETFDRSTGPVTTNHAHAWRSSTAASLYAELRSKLFGERAPARFLRGLELQLAGRRDDQEFDFAIERDILDGRRLSPRFDVMALTAGAKITPWPWLMMRASRATGEQPPTIEALRDFGPTLVPFASTRDPKRGNNILGRDGPLMYSTRGNSELKAVRADSCSLGLVLTPLGEEGPSLAIDYTRIRRSRDVYGLSDFELMEHEAELPGRITRDPLTDADRARGYSAGRVTAFDSRYLNGARLSVDAIDARAEWPVHLPGGHLRLYADATYLLSNRTKEPFQDAIQFAGFVNGPLKRRANGGFDWSSDRLTLGANLQYFGSRSVFRDGPEGALTNEFSETIQGSRRLRSQSYLDLYASWRFPLRESSAATEIDLDLGIINALDTEPPRESSYFTEIHADSQGFSPYGDPRLQRFELELSVHF